MKAENLARWLREEHQKVDVLSQQLQECVASVPRTNHAKWIEQVKQAFEHFRAHIVKHMALEEQDGYMVPVLEHRPALTREVERLAHEHDEFRRILDGIHCLVRELRPEDHLLIRDCCHRIQDFLSYICHHHHDENLMVLSVFTDDIGTTD